MVDLLVVAHALEEGDVDAHVRPKHVPVLLVVFRYFELELEGCFLYNRVFAESNIDKNFFVLDGPGS